MGNLSNSNALRLGMSINWKRRNYSDKGTYFEILTRTNQINDYINHVVRKESFKRLGAILSYCNVHFDSYKTNIVFAIYNSPVEEFINDNRRTSKFLLNTTILNQKIFGKYITFSRLFKLIKYNNKRFAGKKRTREKAKAAGDFVFNNILRGKPLEPIFKRITTSILNKVVMARIRVMYNDIRMIRDRFVYIKLHVINKRTINTEMMLRYVKLRLQQFNRFNEIAYPLLRTLKRSTWFTGFLIRCAGRLTRQQRASFHELQFGRVKFSTYSYPLEFGYDTAILKFGMASIRIWISRGFKVATKKKLYLKLRRFRPPSNPNLGSHKLKLFQFRRLRKVIKSKKRRFERRKNVLENSFYYLQSSDFESGIKFLRLWNPTYNNAIDKRFSSQLNRRVGNKSGTSITSGGVPLRRKGKAKKRTWNIWKDRRMPVPLLKIYRREHRRKLRLRYKPVRIHNLSITGVSLIHSFSSKLIKDSQLIKLKTFYSAYKKNHINYVNEKKMRRFFFIKVRNALNRTRDLIGRYVGIVDMDFIRLYRLEKMFIRRLLLFLGLPNDSDKYGEFTITNPFPIFSNIGFDKFVFSIPFFKMYRVVRMVAKYTSYCRRVAEHYSLLEEFREKNDLLFREFMHKFKICHIKHDYSGIIEFCKEVNFKTNSIRGKVVFNILRFYERNIISNNKKKHALL